MNQRMSCGILAAYHHHHYKSRIRSVCRFVLDLSERWAAYLANICYFLNPLVSMQWKVYCFKYFVLIVTGNQLKRSLHVLFQTSSLVFLKWLSKVLRQVITIFNSTKQINNSIVTHFQCGIFVSYKVDKLA